MEKQVEKNYNYDGFSDDKYVIFYQTFDGGDGYIADGHYFVKNKKCKNTTHNLVEAKIYETIDAAHKASSHMLDVYENLKFISSFDVISVREAFFRKGYNIITLCGSTRFKKEFIEVQKDLTLQGNIVISVGLFRPSDDIVTDEQKMMLDDMHRRKIDMADEIFVIDVEGYIGESTKSEVEYAKSIGKSVRYYSKEY